MTKNNNKTKLYLPSRVIKIKGTELFVFPDIPFRRRRRRLLSIKTVAVSGGRLGKGGHAPYSSGGTMPPPPGLFALPRTPSSFPVTLLPLTGMRLRCTFPTLREKNRETYSTHAFPRFLSFPSGVNTNTFACFRSGEVFLFLFSSRFNCVPHFVSETSGATRFFLV